MTDPVPSKDRVSELIEQWGAYKQWLESGGREIEHSTAYAMTGDTITALKDVVSLREDCRRWANAHQILIAENDRLRKQVAELSVHAEKWVKRALAEINGMIVYGRLPGDGTDQTAQRNGIILAANKLREIIDRAPPPPGDGQA